MQVSLNSVAFPACSAGRFGTFHWKQKEEMNAPPQRVISKINCCGAKNSLIEQPVLGQLAVGVPRSEVEIVVELEESELGTAARSKNQILYNGNQVM